MVAGLLVACDYRRPFLLRDKPLLRHLGKYLETALRYAAYSGESKNRLKDIMLGLLRERQRNDGENEILQRLTHFHDPKGARPYYCLAAICRVPHITAQYAAYQLEWNLPDTVAVPFESMTVVLYAGKPLRASGGALEKVVGVSNRLSMHAGCSNAFDDFFSLAIHYQQAASALLIGGSKNSSQTLHHFKDYALEHFFRFGCSLIPAKLLCADCILRLAERDENSAVSYCKSLRIYLETGRNATETARRLHIQRNTFLARLERITRYLDLDLENPDEMLYMELPLRLLDE
jgi:hypothetical protein